MVIILPTVDCDPGIDFQQRNPDTKSVTPTESEKEKYRQSVNILFSIFDHNGMNGKITWFINEIDVDWCKNFSDLLQLMVKRHETLGLHVHHNGLFNPNLLNNYEKVLEETGKAKSQLQKTTGLPCVHHRCGCYFQADYIYQALSDLKFDVLSDVFPGYNGKIKSGLKLDNSMVPLNANPWRHNSNNWLDFTSSSGKFLHIPVHCGGINGLKDLPEKVKANNIKYVCWGIHPHEIQNPDGTINDATVQYLNQCFSKINNETQPVYMNFNELETEFNNAKI